MKAHIPERSPLTEDRLSPEQVDMYLMLSVLREKHGFGKKRLALFLGDFAANKEQYNKLRYTKGKKHADLELRKATINCYEAVSGIMQEHTGKPFTAGKLTEVQANHYVFLSILHLRHGFGTHRLTELLADCDHQRKWYDRTVAEEGKWSADAQLLRMVEEGFAGEVTVKDLL